MGRGCCKSQSLVPFGPKGQVTVAPEEALAGGRVWWGLRRQKFILVGPTPQGVVGLPRDTVRDEPLPAWREAEGCEDPVTWPTDKKPLETSPPESDPGPNSWALSFQTYSAWGLVPVGWGPLPKGVGTGTGRQLAGRKLDAPPPNPGSSPDGFSQGHCLRPPWERAY